MMWSEDSRLFPSLRQFRSFWTSFTLPVRWLVSCLFLACCHFAVLTPLALLVRLLFRDFVGLWWAPARRSDDRKAPAVDNLRSYFRCC